MTIVDILVPVISAIGFLVVGGSLAVFVLPKFFDAVLLTKTDSLEVSRGWVSMAVMFGLLLLFMPMTFYARASPRKFSVFVVVPVWSNMSFVLIL